MSEYTSPNPTTPASVSPSGLPLPSLKPIQTPPIPMSAPHVAPTPAPMPAPVVQHSRLGFFSLGCLTSLVILIGIPIGLLALLAFSFGDVDFKEIGTGKLNEKIISEGSSLNKVAVVEVYGVITFKQSERVIKVLERVCADSNYKALVLRVNSPGGEVTASDLIYNAVNKVQATGKPVVVMMESLAASGGYYISANADLIMANPTTLTGSIGVIMAGLNYAEGMSKIGLKAQVYASGAFKDMFSPMREPTNAESVYIQSMVDADYERFVGIVSQGRNLTKEQLVAANAIDGRVISGAKAQEIGLVDTLGYFEEALDCAKKLGSCPDATVVRLATQSSFEEFLEGAEAKLLAPNEVRLQMDALPLPKLQPGVHYMLPASYVTGSIIE